MERSKRHVVVVDDDAGMRLAMEQLLLAAGFEVSAFRSAEELLGRPASSGVACLVLDVHLPGLSGFDLCERVRPKPGEPPVIFITAHDSPAYRERARRLGAVAYLTKPFAGRTVLDVLKTITPRGDSPERTR